MGTKDNKFKNRFLAAIFSFGALLSLPGCAEKAEKLKNDIERPAISETTTQPIETSQTTKSEIKEDTNPQILKEEKIEFTKMYKEPSESSDEVQSFYYNEYTYSDDAMTKKDTKVSCKILDKPYQDENGKEWCHIQIEDETGNIKSGYILSQYVEAYSYEQCFIGGDLKDGQTISVTVVTPEGETIEQLACGDKIGPLYGGAIQYDKNNNQYIVPTYNRDIEKGDNIEKVYYINADCLDSTIYSPTGFITSYSHSKFYEDISLYSRGEIEQQYTCSYNGDPGYRLVCGYNSEYDNGCLLCTNKDGKQYIVNNRGTDDIESLANVTHLTPCSRIKAKDDYQEYQILADRNLRTTPGIDKTDENKNLGIIIKGEDGNTITTNIVIPQGTKIMINNNEKYNADGYEWSGCTYNYNDNTVHGYIATAKLANPYYMDSEYVSYIQPTNEATKTNEVQTIEADRDDR